jgi:hypothetical protein
MDLLTNLHDEKEAGRQRVAMEAACAKAGQVPADKSA